MYATTTVSARLIRIHPSYLVTKVTTLCGFRLLSPQPSLAIRV
jgi:hypothetical protein